MTELNTQVTKYIAIANANLTQGIELKNILDIDIGDIEINFIDGLASTGINVTPAFFEMVQTGMIAFADEIRSYKARAMAAKSEEIHYITI